MANTAQKNSRYIYAVDACKAAQSYGYKFESADLLRLKEFSVELTGQVEANLSFFHNRIYKPFVRVELSAKIGYPCQRCFSNIKHDLVIDRELVVLLSDQQDEQNFAPDHEPVWLDEELALDVVQVIEDEILLAIPSHPLHDDPGCNESTDSKLDHSSSAGHNDKQGSAEEEDEIDSSGETTRPFANLKQLLEKKAK